MTNAQNENRTKGGGIYYESHHIVPDFMFKLRKRKGPRGHLDGNPESPTNKVLLTFKEHLMAHYYLYEILKGSRYEYSAGSALQFFFIKATGNHMRQRNLSDIDEDFLNEMQHLREIGCKSISNARKGKMPVVDAKTGEKMGSVPVNHPRVLSGEWQHHSKGKPGTKQPVGYGVGSANRNYKEMTPERRMRVLKCVGESCDESIMFRVSEFQKNIKCEFKEFKKISTVWVLNNFLSWENLVSEYNLHNKIQIRYIFGSKPKRTQ